MSVSFLHSHFSVFIAIQLELHLAKIRQQMTLQCPHNVCTIRYFTPYPNCSIFSSLKFQHNESRKCHTFHQELSALISDWWWLENTLLQATISVIACVLVFIFVSCDDSVKMPLNLIAIKLFFLSRSILLLGRVWGLLSSRSFAEARLIS